MTVRLWVLVGGVVALSGAWLLYSSSLPRAHSVERPGKPPVLFFAADDPALEEAAEQARRTVDTFLTELARTHGPPSQAQLKVRIEEGDIVEHVWLVDLRYEHGMLYGVVGNDPLELREWKRGDPAMVDPNEISDWLLINEQGLQGGFTLRAARERIPPDDLESFNASFAAHFGVDPEGLFND